MCHNGLKDRLTGNGTQHIGHVPNAGEFTEQELQPMKTTMTRIALLCLTVTLIQVLGCGYSTRRPFPTDIKTVHVEMFHSREFRRELEFRLTEAIIKRMEMDTTYRIASQRKADALLTGEILSVDNHVFGDDLDTDRPREIGSTIAVRFRLQDMRTGEILVERPRFVFQTSYIPPVGETFTTGMTRALDGLAEQMVESMETKW